MSDDRPTVVEQGTALTGILKSSGRVVVRGRMDGEVTAPTVEVAGTGTVHGTVKATSLRSRGELGGRFEADDIELGGRVLDETVIHAKALQVTFDGEAGMIFGTCDLEIGDAPDKARAVREAHAARRARPAEVAAAAPAADA
jgi:cytoskeletal protein CcmA (bactofilin family)